MEITLNGDPRTTCANATVQSLVCQLGLEGKRLAVEVNEKVVPRSQYPVVALGEGDRVEIVQAIGGG